ncbi:hypothetical protein COCCADRAFT_94175, partial [Bipolaris zeicola 26-R-13]
GQWAGSSVFAPLNNVVNCRQPRHNILSECRKCSRNYYIRGAGLYHQSYLTFLFPSSILHLGIVH